MKFFFKYLIFISVPFTLLFVKNGFEFDRILLSVMGVLSLLVAIPFYFDSITNQQPSVFERSLAGIWVFFRRLVCFTGAIVCIAALVLMTMKGRTDFVLQESLAALVFLFVLWGIIGRTTRGGLQDDIDYNKQRKNRYRPMGADATDCEKDT